MEQGIIQIAQLSKLIDALGNEYTVYGPVKTDDGEVVLSKLTSEVEVNLDFVNFRLSPKEFFFPHREVLSTFEQNEIKELSLSKERFVAFAARPCDADAVKDLDRVFNGESTGYTDPYFAAKRQRGVLIALACDTPCTTCFCTSVGSSPNSEEGADILMIRQEKALLFKTCTDKGRDLMKAHAGMFSAVGNEEEQAYYNKAAAVAEKVRKVEIEGITEKLAGEYNSEVWNDMFTRCLGCGVCTYLCPTCHCFDIMDETEGVGKGQRVRAWDSCQFSLFTLHASGHNPRPSKKERMRQRMMHKFSYTVENFEKIFCVGCGRCVRYCPVNLDIREMLQTLSSI